MRVARAGGEGDATELFCVGAHAYLLRTWERRELAQIFLGYDGPPGFEQLRGESWNEWISRNASMLAVEGSVEHRMTVGLLTNIISGAAREIVYCKRKRQALEIIDVAERMIRRVWPEQAD